MRLLHTETLKLHEFSDEKIPPYVILSHTWGENEVSLQEMMSGKGVGKKGYDKILGCCQKVVDNGMEYVWIDTCCIDKTSSSELSEAINSMFRWYQEAEVCYVVLADVPNLFKQNPEDEGSAFRESRWFTRGWTLQELIAPKALVFYSSDWADIGTKWSLKTTVSEITGISVGGFNGEPLSKFSIAQRMSWASRRKTTRIEDAAYCLMGLFDINMPMIYGEGDRAFLRLQEEILKYTDDQSIFAWTIPYEDIPLPYQGSFLASSPRAFGGAGRIVPTSRKEHLVPIRLNNGCIETQLRLASDASIAILACKMEGDDEHLCISVERRPGGNVSVYSRTFASDLLSIKRAEVRKHGSATILNQFKFHREPPRQPFELPIYINISPQDLTKISLVQIQNSRDMEFDDFGDLKLGHNSKGLWQLRFQGKLGCYFDLQVVRNVHLAGPSTTVNLRQPDRSGSEVSSLHLAWPGRRAVTDRLKWFWKAGSLWVVVMVVVQSVEGKMAAVVGVQLYGGPTDAE